MQRMNVCLAFCILVATAGSALSEYPERAITLVVPIAAGGQTDAIARIVAEPMSKSMGQAIVIENIAGAGGTTGTTRVAQSKADGYTIMMGQMGTHGAAPALYPGLKYDPAKDFVPIGMAAIAPMLVVTRKGFPPDNLGEFINYVKANQGSVTEGHAGVGSQSHTVCTLLHSTLGTKTARVPYRGLGPVVNDLVGGQIDFACGDVGSFVSQIQAGNLKALAVASPTRADIVRDVPTTLEAGLPELQASSWNVVFAPSGTPQEAQAKLVDALEKALDDPQTRKRLNEIGSVVPDAAERKPLVVQKFVESEVARWTTLLKAAGITAN